MRLSILILVILSLGFFSLSAQETIRADKTDKKDSDISSSTKKVLRKIGRKARDESCDWTEKREDCLKEKAAHRLENKADRLDTKERRMEKAQKKYVDKVEQIEKDDIEDQKNEIIKEKE